MLSFAALACLFGWSNYLASAVGLGENPENNPLGPLAAALVVLACQGRRSLAVWWKRVRSWRSTPGWYALAILTPALVAVVNVLINHSLGAPLPTSAQLSQWPDIPVTFLAMIVLVGLGEEGGWSAFAAPVLLRRHGLLGAWVILSALRIFWHLPLLIGGQMPWTIGIIGNAGFQLIVLAMMSPGGGRWFLAALWHATVNAFGNAFFFSMVTGADRDRLGVLLSIAYAVIAIGALAITLRRPEDPTPAAADASRPVSLVQPGRSVEATPESDPRSAV
jgi:hypothetical protein